MGVMGLRGVGAYNLVLGRTSFLAVDVKATDLLHTKTCLILLEARRYNFVLPTRLHNFSVSF